IARPRRSRPPPRRPLGGRRLRSASSKKLTTADTGSRTEDHGPDSQEYGLDSQINPEIDLHILKSSDPPDPQIITSSDPQILLRTLRDVDDQQDDQNQQRDLDPAPRPFA